MQCNMAALIINMGFGGRCFSSYNGMVSITSFSGYIQGVLRPKAANCHFGDFTAKVRRHGYMYTSSVVWMSLDMHVHIRVVVSPGAS